MRPIKITMSAFGAYKGTTVLDMESLGSQGVYLITGETGAGKTTVFDAIVFALYGSASGDSRDGKMMRSLYADKDTPTFVDMEFEVRGERYRVKRNPEYERPKLRGDGTVTEAAGAELYLPDGTVFGGKLKDTNDKIKEIMRVDRNQFCKIAMLAQGDFQKFLLDSTEKKTELLRKVFSTQIFEKMQNILKEEYSAADQRCRELSKDIDRYLSYIKLAEPDPIEIELENAVTLKEKRAVIKKLIERDNDIVAKLKEKIDSLENKINEVNGNLTSAQTRIEKQAEKEKITASIKQKNNELEMLTGTYKKAKSKESEKNNLLSTAQNYKKSISDYKKADELRDKYNSLEKELNSTQVKLTSSKNDLDSCQKELDSYKNTESEFNKAKANADTLDKALGYLKKYLSALEKKDQICKSLADAQSKYSQADKEYNLASEAYLNEQAGFLAAGLKDGVACPVCGSPHHPAPAKLTQGAPDKKTVDRLKEERKKADESRNDLSAQLNVINERIDSSLTELKALTKKEEFTPNDLEVYNASQKKINSKINLLEKNLNRKEELEKQLPQLQSDINMKTEAVNKLNVQLAQLEGEVKAIKLEFKNEEAAKNEIIRLEADAKKIQNEIDNALESLNNCKNSIAELKAIEVRLAKELENTDGQIDDVEKLKTQLNELRIKKVEASDEHVAVSGRLNANRDTAKLIDDCSSNMLDAEEERAWKKSLSDTANGNISNHHKIKLEAYVLSEYFRRVLGRASARLMVMSDNHYELEIHNEADNMKSQSGLEIDVIDHYNGTRRSVKSLSGGEKFMASLSIALGLSDEVQSSAGGVQLDTMFVDEGFGSLDSNSLELAMRALSGIAQSNRLVGIISHVDALNERIDKKIVVTKNAGSGSTARIEV